MGYDQDNINRWLTGDNIMNTEQRFDRLQSIDLADLSNDKVARVIAISGGKRGDGASSVAINLAVELSRLDKTVCLLDVNRNLANHDIYKALSPQLTLQDVLDGNKQLQDVMIDGPQGTRILATDSGLVEWSAFNAAPQRQIIDIISYLESSFDYLLIGPGSGIDETVLSFVEAAPETLITITSDPNSLKSAFSLLQEMTRRDFDRPVHLVVNRVKNTGVAGFTIDLFSAAVKLFLGLDMATSSHILEHDNPAASVSQQLPYDLLYPRTQATRCMRNLAYRLIGSHSHQRAKFSDYLAQIETPCQQEDTNETTAIEQPMDPQPEDIEDGVLISQPETSIESDSFQQTEQTLNEESLSPDEYEPPQDRTAYTGDQAGYLSAIHFACELNKQQSDK